LYNLIDLRHEGRVLDLVRKHGMQFVAHNPQASGFLRGTLTTGQIEGTRFSEGDIMSMDARRYDTKKHHTAFRFLGSTLEPHGIPKTETSLRWLAFHSKIGLQDAIIFESSKMHQLRQNVAAAGKVPLPEEVVKASDGICETLQYTIMLWTMNNLLLTRKHDGRWATAKSKLLCLTIRYQLEVLCDFA
jgi:aflatoxin B1 aldehyde reductase